MTTGDGTLRILLSRDAAGKLAGDIRRVMGSRPHVLVFPDEPAATSADIAFVSRDVTGLSTKHDIKPDTQAFYDALRDANSLRWVHTPSAGLDRPIYEVLQARGVTVTPSAGVSAPVMAHSALLAVLTLARRMPLHAQRQREHRWVSQALAPAPDIRGKKVVVVGWGPAGRESARLLRELGMQVRVVRHTAEPAGEHLPTVTYARLREFLPDCDFLLLVCPLTDATRGLVGREELALLPPHCGLVNIARGDVVDEAALTDALTQGRIGSAFLDVFAHEPLPAESALWDLPNVVVTPHCAGISDANESRIGERFLELLARFARGEALSGGA
jgi:phosphoglycerate dehydrogenase-like enzyme